MGARILLIEDNPANLELATYLLETGGYEVIAAEDGEEGLALLKQQRPDIVVTDLQMPVVDGYEVLRRLRQDASFDVVPVIAVTAFSMSGDRVKVLRAGFDGYLSKPIVPEIFVSQIDAFLKAGRRLGPLPEDQ
ncbi:response regulator [Azoarcus sp. KH32C]|uniref:response regulator n=1 Tax=Azoarcus sp. KH32C TaxID=748247 RepID=UPI0002385ED7|nr:response regulator [Azoarcus sp. KH32C]BAL24503.1 polar differentiation response regulator [Azoarcus sp. KH32C]